MLKKTITFTDYNGEKRTEDFYFNLTKAEVTEMELEISGGMRAMLEKIIAAQDTPSLVKVFKDLILRAYGEKSADGKHFFKEDKDGHKLVNLFVQTEAYSELFMELATNADAASEFINAIFPADIVEKAKELEAK
ncbi:hypothetical protein [Methanobrevibacter sp.]|uniref:hypothetical protein n=1 Tax=Methanobrevibacter sp. TaxID=66852 RepID=UPI00388D13F5